MATYPTNPALPQGTNATAVNPTNWNTFVDNINAIGLDLVTARGDGQAFPGTDHSSGQSSNIDDALQALRHIIAHATGETNWYDAPAGSLKVHNHSTGQGGAVGWGNLGGSSARNLVFHPQYGGAIQTNSQRGGAASGNNTITVTTGEDVVSWVARHYYQGESAEPALQDTYIALRITLPIDFSAWQTTGALQVEYKTESALSNDCHIDLYVYKSGSASVIVSSENNVNLNWSNISIGGSALGSWSAGDIMEIYLKLESRANNFARIGKVTLNYTA